MVEARDSRRLLLMSQINVGEVYYILSRKRGVEKADYFLRRVDASQPSRRSWDEGETV